MEIVPTAPFHANVIKNYIFAVIGHNRAGSFPHVDAAPETDITDNAAIGKGNAIAIHHYAFARRASGIASKPDSTISSRVWPFGASVNVNATSVVGSAE